MHHCIGKKCCFTTNKTSLLERHCNQCAEYQQTILQDAAKYRELRTRRKAKREEKIRKTATGQAIQSHSQDVPMVVDETSSDVYVGNNDYTDLPSPSTGSVSDAPSRDVAAEIGRPTRERRLPRRYRSMQDITRVRHVSRHLDVIPEGPSPAINPEPIMDAPPNPSAVRRVILHVWDSMRTAVNAFGVLREYPHRPSFDPDAAVRPEDLADYHNKGPCEDIQGGLLNSDSFTSTSAPPADRAPPWPFANMSIWRLMNWFSSGSGQKSVGETNRLVHDVLLADDFTASDLHHFRVAREAKRIDGSEEDTPDVASDAQSAPFAGDGWRKTSVDIDIPTGERDSPKSPGYKTFSISGLHYRCHDLVRRLAIF
ncbi:hypothetical protein POSPLADRAFT_1163150 [Postia placenta MAD-698-R-SB12]|uniref:Uncharacterized protein n=1 Tax=Postia placenta MAD-698-R-SB12 TaxID=670580 RepID=A0A1X6MH99_9APHY|nr:hypothetical protein POSPLADRAFT_1163150 [Postia placenta MAD-698-R-SB12]OSX55787.1 hypothetical protein POSPLADRAFT_1163150 [Postia placenta MAD-698-R-SB12]